MFLYKKNLRAVKYKHSNCICWLKELKKTEELLESATEARGTDL
jgi:hypothetical protein